MKMVSVIIPTHGGGKYLQNTIESAYAQDYPNIEIIVVDDNGKNSKNQKMTSEIINKYRERSDFKYIIHEKNINGSAARNTGARYSKGEYLNFIDDDDCFGNEKIKYQVEQLEKLGFDFGASYCSRITKFNGKTSKITKARKSGNILFDYMMHKVTIGTGSLLLRRSVYEDIGGYDETFYRHQDWEFVARIANKYKIIAADEVYFERNYLGRNSPKTIEENSLKYLNHYTKAMDLNINSLSKRQMRKIKTNNYMRIILKYIKAKRIKDAMNAYKVHGNGLLGVYYITQITSKYLWGIIANKRYT